MVNFVEICNVCTRKVVIKAAKRIFNSDKICRIVIVISILASLFWNTVYNTKIASAAAAATSTASPSVGYRCDSGS